VNRLLPIGRDRANAAKVAVFAAAVIGYSVVGGLTRPFTAAADAAAAIPLAIAAVATAIHLRRRAPHQESQAHTVQRLSRFAPWIVIVAVITGFELYTFSSDPRTAHPTLSSLLDQLDSTHVGRTVTFALWLLLGTYLVVA
jgi:hypothetical protein